MTHPHGLTRQDVAHLKAGDEVTLRLGKYSPITATIDARNGGAEIWVLDYLIRHANGDPAAFLVEVISPKPPTPPMAEPAWQGSPVMTDGGLAIYGGSDQGWYCLRGWNLWDELRNPRPLTDAERRDLGIPATLPEGWVCVDARGFSERGLKTWADCPDAVPYTYQLILGRIARAELARREATT